VCLIAFDLKSFVFGVIPTTTVLPDRKTTGWAGHNSIHPSIVKERNVSSGTTGCGRHQRTFDAGGRPPALLVAPERR
jgi:hypothetical protein